MVPLLNAAFVEYVSGKKSEWARDIFEGEKENIEK